MGSGLVFGPGVWSMSPDEEVDRFSSYLLKERGVAARVAATYVRWVSGFVALLTRSDGTVEWARANVAAANAYVGERGAGYARGSLGSLVTAVRVLLLWAFQSGRIAVTAHAGVLRPPDWAMTTVPKFLSDGQAVALLAAVGGFERSNAAVLRDRAALLLLSRLGLRSGEVSGLMVDDVDWRAGLVTVRGKGRVSVLPLPVDVGEALVEYLRNGRPVGYQGRELFLTSAPPARPWSAGALSGMVARAARHAGLGLVHAHWLRRTAATKVLARGGSLADVAQLLGHANLQTAAVYAKTDLASLRELVVEWGQVALP